jgi:hypothetical protein
MEEGKKAMGKFWTLLGDIIWKKQF